MSDADFSALERAALRLAKIWGVRFRDDTGSEAEAPVERQVDEVVVIAACGSMDDYASAFNDGFARALELVREDLGDYCDPDDDPDHAAILQDYAQHLDSWRLAHAPAAPATSTTEEPR